MEKKELRVNFLNIRNNILKRNIKNEIILSKVISNRYVKQADTILIYVSINSEVDTIRLINYFLNKKKVAVPKLVCGKMNFYYINNMNELKRGNFNILEPITNRKVENFDNAICLTPGICFTRDGYRVGYGKGCYDRFFSSNKVYSIGLCYKECITDIIDYDDYDIPVDEVITD